MKPVRIFIDGKELINYTSMRLTRKKKDMTGSLTVEIFLGSVPNRPVVVNAAVARQITVYIANQLAFTGKVDKRNGGPVKQNRKANGQYARGFEAAEGGSESAKLTAEGYKVTLTARGMCKYFMDASQQHPTSTMLKTTNKAAIEELIKPWKIELDWQATEIKMPIVRFNDGGRVVDELFSIGNDTCVFLYETRDGKLRAIDRPGAQMGEPLVVGRNILDYNAEQSESQANSDIKVKGQRSDPEVHGKDAVNRIKVVKDSWVPSNIPLIIQYYGDATDENLERRGKFEADQRAAQSKGVDIDAFGFTQTNGQPWDVGNLHYIEIPGEGIFEVMECVELEYAVSTEGEFVTKLKFAPPPSSSIVGGKTGGSLLDQELIAGLTDAMSLGAARRAQMGITVEPGNYPFSWGPAALMIPVATVVEEVLNPLLGDIIEPGPPLVIRD